MDYDHTQRGALRTLLDLSAGLMFVMAWLSRAVRVPALILVGTGAVFLALGLCFRELTIRDAGDHLRVRFGPLPLFGTRIRYDEITAVEPARTSWLDGWGIHWLPGRGWTYNIWGFDCVRLTVGGRTISVGTDDVDNLVRFLREKTGCAENSEPSPS